MKFDLENLNPGAKFFFDEEEKDGAFVVLRVANAATMSLIRKKAVKEKVEYRNNPKTNRLERVVYTDADEELSTKMLWDYVIADWKVQDAAGKPIPCTMDMKFLLMTESKVFGNFVSKCLDRLNEDEAMEVEACEKNS